ncbi:RING-H2 finger protein ATL63 [Gossypium australe]|uniref:RING-H2 finger protein ATL63 n=1 Tax=Gossypium australe TaxID=47621 RepID=A0A5B6UVG0_9ROSI|nr:RING-H2 finger protein ATL63 [Gossypium australe]
MQNQLSTRGNLPLRENPLFDEVNNNNLEDPPPPPQLPANINMAHNEKTMREYALPNLDMVQGTMTRPAITANNFEIKPTMIQMIQNNLNNDRRSELESNMLCYTFKYNRLIDDVILLQLFPFSLVDNAFSWLDSQTPGSIMTWDKLTGKFL